MSFSATWTWVSAPRLNAPSVKRTRRPLRSIFRSPTAIGSTLSGRMSHGTLATTWLPASASSRPVVVPGLGRRTVTAVGVPGTSVAVFGAGRRAAGGPQRDRRRLGGVEVDRERVERTRPGGRRVGGDAAGGRADAPAPARSAGRSCGWAAAISVARSCCGESSGRARASLAASTATYAAATAVPPVTPEIVSALPSAARSGLGRPPADGPWAVNVDALRAGAVSPLGPRSRGAEADARCRARASSTSLAASPVTPITGAAARPAGSDGSGVSSGWAIRTAAAPTAAAAVAWAAGFAPARTITTLPRMRGAASPRTAGSVSSTGPAVLPALGGVPASTAASTLASRRRPAWCAARAPGR